MTISLYFLTTDRISPTFKQILQLIHKAGANILCCFGVRLPTLRLSPLCLALFGTRPGTRFSVFIQGKRLQTSRRLKSKVLPGEVKKYWDPSILNAERTSWLLPALDGNCHQTSLLGWESPAPCLCEQAKCNFLLLFWALSFHLVFVSAPLTFLCHAEVGQPTSGTDSGPWAVYTSTLAFLKAQWLLPAHVFPWSFQGLREQYLEPTKHSWSVCLKKNLAGNWK